MNPDHIEGTEFCLCDDCTRGFTLITPRVRNDGDIEYALMKLKREIGGTAGWSDADREAVRAARAAGYSGNVTNKYGEIIDPPTTRVMVGVTPVCCAECGQGRIKSAGNHTWYCADCGKHFRSVAAVGRSTP